MQQEKRMLLLQKLQFEWLANAFCAWESFSFIVKEILTLPEILEFWKKSDAEHFIDLNWTMQ